MLCSKIKQIVFTRSTLNNNVQFRYLLTSRLIIKRWVWIDGLVSKFCKNDTALINTMSAFRFLLRDFRVWSAWTRINLVSTVVKRCRRDRSVREVIQCFRQTFFRPRRTLLLSATAAFKARDGDDEVPVGCDKNITDEELQALVLELDGVETLSRNTLFCSGCGKRLVIEKKQPGVPYCVCKVAEVPGTSPDGWVPYMEAEDVVIWRKEYKPGMGLYAYKVYGRYPDVRAQDFAAVQVDGAYRRVWDAAVAALAVVERCANGISDQAVLHWEVLWPRLFANRDYVYIRRHKEFDVVNKGHDEGVYHPAAPCEDRPKPIYAERSSVHSNAKRKAMETNGRERDNDCHDDKVYVIVSRSCEHPDVPETKHAIRVSEYWSHMVVKTLNGADKSGMEFVLTYYDEPAVGGMPSSVSTWATGRAAPAYLQRMRRAAADYQAWRLHTQQEMPDYTPFVSEQAPEEVTTPVCEEEMESSQSGPDIHSEPVTRDQSTQTEAVAAMTLPEVKAAEPDNPEVKPQPLKENVKEQKKDSHHADGDSDKIDEEEPKNG